MFWGRSFIENATAQFYFTKESLMQRLLHLFKYKKDKSLGLQLGRIVGEQLMKSNRFRPDALVPMPLFPAKEKKRGYNQATILCEGISEFMKIPVLKHVVNRIQDTDTQTKKGRIERWRNMEGKFSLTRTPFPEHKHLLLVDDVVTTGATLEACTNELISAGNIRVSICTLCVASH